MRDLELLQPRLWVAVLSGDSSTYQRPVSSQSHSGMERPGYPPWKPALSMTPRGVTYPFPSMFLPLDNSPEMCPPLEFIKAEITDILLSFFTDFL